MDWFIILSVAIIAFGYGGFALVLPRRKAKVGNSEPNWPQVSFIIPAFNEKDFLADKIANTLACDYPKELLEIIVAADGTTDDSEALVRELGVRYENNGARKGKGVAMNRAAKYAAHDILIFSDANAMLNVSAIKEIVRPLTTVEYAMSSGEKKVIQKSEIENASAGEGLYWKYESYLKKRDSDFHTLVGAVGELFAIKKSFYQDIPANFLIDDFYEAACVLQKGSLIKYVPDALATEFGSLNFKEEIKRKIRISAGGYQAMIFFKSLFNPLNNWKVTYIFVAHRVLRWTIIPVLYFAIPIYTGVKFFIMDNWLYSALTMLFVGYFLLVLAGMFFNMRDKKAPFFINIPFYITLMNYCALAGGIKYFSGIKSGAWEKVKRAG